MDALPAGLEDGRVDLAFVRLPMALPGGLRAHVLLRDRFCVALPAEHALADAAGPVRSRVLAGETFVVPEQDLGTREVARRGRFEPRIGSAPGGLLAVLAQVSLGAGVAVVPGVLAGAVSLPNVVFRPLAGEPVVSEVAAVYRRQERSPAVRNLVAQLLRAAP
jgi:DNA-binding transcriptional LysR family regulator